MSPISAFIVCLLLAISEASNDTLCKGGLHIENVYYDKAVLKTGLDRPYQLAIDKETDLLFFSYSINTDIDDHFKSAYIDLNTNEFSEIGAVKNGFATTVHNGAVYMGGSDGIYKFDKKEKTAVKTNITENNIWIMFSNEDLFFVSYPELILHKYKDGKSEPVKEFEGNRVNQYATDKNGNTFFYNDEALYVFGKASNVTTATLLTSEIVIRGINFDKDGKTYMIGENGIYKYEDGEFVHIYPSSDIFGIAFDSKNNMLLASYSKITKLTPTKKICKRYGDL